MVGIFDPACELVAPMDEGTILVYCYSPSADRLPSKKETPRRTVLYRITRQLLHRVSTASFESCTEKKENQIFLIYKEIQSGAVAKLYMRKSFLIYEEMRNDFPIYEEVVSHIQYDFATAPL